MSIFKKNYLKFFVFPFFKKRVREDVERIICKILASRILENDEKSFLVSNLEFSRSKINNRCCNLFNLKFVSAYFLYKNINKNLSVMLIILEELQLNSENLKVFKLHLISFKENIKNWQGAPEIQHLVK